jgi:hypothetical protein
MGKKYIRGAKVLIFALGFLVLGLTSLPAQTAAELEAVLETSAVTCAQAARFVTASSGSAASETEGAASSGASLPDADFQQAMENGWFPRGTTPDENITLGKLSFLIMRAFNIKGGMMYAILPGPRYAFRTMVSRSFIQGAADPSMTVNGERFLHILGKVLNTEGEES